MKPVIFIDGREGTTGLQIYDRLTPRQDIELLLIDEEKRKDPAERKKCLNAADLVFLCLPDEAAREAVAMIDNPNTRVIDASTAHRTAPGWDYGFPELSPHHRARIVCSKRVANPGCHASGFIASVYPLVQLGLIPPDHPLCAYSLTGYSGGGKKLIAEYQDPHRDPRHASARIYGTNLHHKHLPEMVHVCGLAAPPVFHPILGDYIQGMATTVLLRNDTLPGRPTAQEIHQALSSYYAGQTFVSVAPFGGDEPVIYSDTLVGTNQLRLIVCGHEAQTTVTALFDNLGKGASGAAVQNMNLMLGFAETAGLEYPAERGSLPYAFLHHSHQGGFSVMNIITGGVTAPKGFQAAGIHCGIKDNFTTPQPDKKDLAMILSSVPCAAAGTYTRNVVKADPVILTKEHLADHQARGIIFDSGNANACAPKGRENAQRMAQAAAAATGLRPQDFAVCSTGIIGVELNIQAIEKGVPSLVAALADTPQASLDAAHAILTTDLKVKEIAVTVELGGKTVTIGAIAKGSGMIRPSPRCGLQHKGPARPGQRRRQSPLHEPTPKPSPNHTDPPSPVPGRTTTFSLPPCATSASTRPR